jgi:pantetheine-phosphate adenylyltransferase
MTYSVALIVGRFQPFHKGHLYLFKKALKVADKIVIAIGSANINDENNPLNFETRKKIIKAVAYKEKIEEKIIKIVPLDDFFDDKKWLNNLRMQVGNFDVALGNNDWTNNILEKAGYKVIKVNHYKRNMYEGWRIRKLFRKGLDFKDRVPKYIYPYIISNFKFLISKQTSNFQKPISKFNHVVLGGTFDHFHKGHEVLLTKAFEIGRKMTIGIATEKLFKKKLLAEIIEPLIVRKKSVSEFLKKKGWISRAKLISFSHFSGGADKEKEFDAIIVSKRTYPNALKINQLREKNHLQTLRIIIIPDVIGDDGKLISSERIRAGEIDREGKEYIIQSPKSKIHELIMPESLRTTLQKPLGKIYKSVGAILESPKNPTMIIAVGDIIVNGLLEKGIDPDVKIIDFRSRRQPFKTTGPVSSFLPPVLASKNTPRLRAVGIPPLSTPVVNNHGTINIKTAEVIKGKIKFALYKKTKSWIVIKGEEDLLALPAILFAPLGSLVLYGHWQLGIIVVSVNEKIKNRIKKIIKKFN